MRYTIKDIAAALGAEAFGAVDLEITHAAEPANATPDALALAMDEKYADGLAQGNAQAALLWAGADWQALGLKAAIFVPRARYAMSGVTKLLDPAPEIAPGIHPLACVDATAKIGSNAAIGPFVVIGPRAVIGKNARIANHASIAEDAVIGDDALIYAGVRISARVQIGDRFIVQPGAAIGGDGFSFVTPEKSSAERARENLGADTLADDAAKESEHNQSWTRIHSLGTVEIGNDVEIGSNSTVDRGTIRATRIGDRTKIDNLVHIGHNVEIGEDVLICGQAGMAGSCRIGNRVVIGGRVAINDNIFVGDDVVAGGGSNVFTNAPAGRVLLGSPAVKMETQLEIQKAVRRLPRMAKQFAELQKAVSKLGKNS